MPAQRPIECPKSSRRRSSLARRCRRSISQSKVVAAASVRALLERVRTRLFSVCRSPAAAARRPERDLNAQRPIAAGLSPATRGRPNRPTLTSPLDRGASATPLSRTTEQCEAVRADSSDLRAGRSASGHAPDASIATRSAILTACKRPLRSNPILSRRSWASAGFFISEAS
jgi:hypothetical protein